MADLNDIYKTDLVDDVLASGNAGYNKLLASALYANYRNVETLSATKELDDDDYQIQLITPSGSDQTVELPPEAITNHLFWIACASGASYSVVVKDDSGTTTLATLTAGSAGLFVSDGSQWLTVSGGGALGDLLSDLVSSEISVTGAVTATISTMHVCTDSGTPADYTVALPAVSGNAGKLIGIRVSMNMTKLVTLDGSGSEEIDGQTTRVMWAGESAILLCDGTSWTKIAGKSIPMIAEQTQTSSETMTSGVAKLLALGTSFYDNTGAMVDTSLGRINIVRSGRYRISLRLTGQVLIVGVFQARYAKNGSIVYVASDFNTQRIFDIVETNFSLGDYLTMYGYHAEGSDRGAYGDGGQGTSLFVEEVITW